MLKLQKIQKTVSGAIHLAKDYGSEETGANLGSACGAGENGYPWYEMPEDTEVTCKRCLKKLQKAEDLGLFLKSVRNEDGSYRVVDIRKEDAEDAPEIKPGRCLQRVGKVGKTPTQCIKAHAHEDDHEDRFGDTYGNHLTVPTADPLSPTAQAVLDANRVWEEAMTDAWRSEGTERQEEADAAYEVAEKALREAREAHHAALMASREQRDARRELARLEAPKGAHPLAKRLADDHGLNFF